MTLRLLMARHGESEWQVRGDAAGGDSPLTDLGRQQADRLGRWLAGHIPVDYIYASPLQRARETARLAARYLDRPVVEVEGLREAWFLVAPELPARPEPAAILDDGASPSAASQDYRRFRRQVREALRHILSRHSAGTLLLVAHGGTVETAIRLLLGSDQFTVNMGNTTLHSLVWHDGHWHIEYIDRWEHLR